jgi:hypothetical protein
MLVGGLMLSSTLANKRAFNFDMKRVLLDQNLRSGMDILGADLRVGGENLPTSFPAFEIINGVAGAADELVVRRNLIDEVLPVCTSIPTGSTALQVYFAVGGATTAACTYSGQTYNYNSWRTYRTNNSGTVRAFIYDVAAKNGEFFNYTNEGSTGTAYYILRNSGSWTFGYPALSSSVYILEEWRFKLVSGVLQIEVNGQPATPQNVVAGLSDFQVRALMNDATVKTTMTRIDDWSQMQALEVTLSGATTYQKKALTRTLTSRFFPRNILSK